MTAPKFSTEMIRNVAVTGHSDTGKTTLVSGLLYASGVVNRFGTVDEGHAPTDFDEDEIERKITISTAVAHLTHEDLKINLIDTPGYGIFTTEAIQGVHVADSVAMLVSAVAGVEVQTEKLWKAAEDRGLPVMLLVNLMDRDRASFDRTVEDLQNRFGREVVPLQLPIGQENDFKGMVDLVSGRAMTWEHDGSGKFDTGDAPEEMQEAVVAARESLMEMVAEQDEELMEAYVEAGELDEQALRRGLAAAVRNRNLFPVFSLAAGKNIAIQPILDALGELAPSPESRSIEARDESGEAVEVEVGADRPVLGYVFKTFSDPYAGRITLMRTFTGTLQTDVTLLNSTSGSKERLGGLSVMQGKELEQVGALAAGDIAAVPKLKETHTGDTLCEADHPLTLDAVRIPEPAISFALEPKSKGDEDKLSNGLARIREEDPTIKVGRDPQTGELLISGAGQLHVEVVIARLKKRYKVDVVLHPPKVPYRETITASAEATYRHKKQTGGAGQFAECKIAMEPLPRDEGYEFVDKIFGGSISQGYRPAVDKGIQEAAAQGVLAGYPLADFRVTLLDGKEHSVDSSEMAFKTAGRKAFEKCAADCKPTLLEPIMQVDVQTPEELMGDVMGDLNSRRGRVQGMDSEGGTSTIHAQVPLAEMLQYAPTLRSITGGRGDYHMEFSHYAEVPKQLQEKIIAESKKEKDDD